MIWASIAFAAPTVCDPARDTAPVQAGGYCLDEEAYAEVGRLRLEVESLRATVAARDAELLVFEEWKVARDEEFNSVLDAVRSEATAGVERVQSVCDEDLENARRRTLGERHGMIIGTVVGSTAMIVLTVLTLDIYGEIITEHR